MIKDKMGICIDCGPEAGERVIMAKRCCKAKPYHYQLFKTNKYKAKMKTSKSEKNSRIAAQNNGLTVDQWFSEQIAIMPRNCENCSETLYRNAIWGCRTYIAHIVPKRSFESVTVHPMNRLFLCGDCHTNFDRKGSDYIVGMTCWPVAVQRFNSFKHMIQPFELPNLLPCFESIL